MRHTFGCRITQKAWTSGHRVFVQVENQTMATELDELLWTFSQQSFIPHAIAGTPEAAHAAVVIGTDPALVSETDLLISLVDQVPATPTRFNRIIEIVAADESAKARARERFRQYRDLGVEPQTHSV